MDIRIRLQAFHTPGDERRFFEGLLGIAGVQSCRGVVRDLIVALDLRRLNREAVLDLMALLRRYRISRAPLRELAGRRKYAWLDDPAAAWYREVFGRSASGPAS